jgi:potassium efflux system protein
MSFELPRRLESLKKLVFWPILLGLLLAVVPPVFAQGDQTAAPSQMPTPAPTPIPASQIPARTGEVAALLRGMEAGAQPKDKVVEIADALPTTKESIDLLEQRTLPLIEGDGSSQGLKDADADLARHERKLTGWLDTLNGRTVELDGDLADLRNRKELWELTRNDADAAELPAALVTQVRETQTAIRNTEKTTLGRRYKVLTLQAEVAEQRSRLKALRDQLAGEIEIRQQHLLRMDSPPLWKAFGQPQEDNLLEQMLETRQRNLAVLDSFLRDNVRRIVRDAVVFVVVLILFIWLGRKARLWAQSDESLRTTAALLQRPVASSLLVTIIVLGGWIYPTAPTAFLNLSGLVLLLVMLRLLPHLARREMRPTIGLLVVLVALYLLVELIPSTFLLDRLGKLALALLGAATCGWVVHRQRALEQSKKDFWYWGAMWLATIAAVFFSLSALANIIGAVAFSSLLAMATLASIYDAIALWVLVAVLFGAATVALRTTTARRLLIVRYHSDRIRSVIFRLIKVVAVLSWLGYFLDHFGLLNWAVSRIKAVVLYDYHLGGFSISVSSVVVFFVVIWLSVKLSQLIRFLLDEDVLPRLDLPKGVPATISKTSTYLLVTIGCVIAVAAAGLDLSRLTIVIGALGVGIGFGLQNAVNNFVSGLILLFGRPINVGDKIEIGEVFGVVKDIGIRATVVQTWQGAEVIVPNATLISENLINWTLTDPRRRMEIPVGVAYGSPTEKVIELLTEVARAHDEVLEDPEPKTIFTGFGDSSLDFELRAWTVGDHVTIASDLRVGIDRALADYEIAIPFPQRDLHLRSVGKGAAERLAEGVAVISTEVKDGEPTAPPEPVADEGADGDTS